MDEMHPFLRTIAENPDDDTPRLVFADWLDEHDQHDRARFIRLQIELARMDPSDDGYAEKTAKMRRCGVFTEQGKHPFFDYLPTGRCNIGFQRGFIEVIDTCRLRWDAPGRQEKLDTSGFELVPLQSLRTDYELIDEFRRFTKLKWFEYHGGRVAEPAKLLEILGPKGWFKNLETLSLPDLNRACLEAGVIPQFDLPKLRNFCLCTESFYTLGEFVDGEEEDDWGDSRTWTGLPNYLPKNAIPNQNSPLERFVWHADDDSDVYRGNDRFWAGPTMESFLSHLKPHKLKQFEVAVDYDDHEGGTEGVDSASYEQNPLQLCPTLEYITLDGDLELLHGSTQKLKGLRVYAAHELDDYLFTLLDQPVCSELESLHVEVRGWWNAERADDPSFNLQKLKHLSVPPVTRMQLSKCQFPNLVSLTGFSIKTIMERKWPKLQHLDLGEDSDSLPEFKRFIESDCCPYLTTLTISGHFRQEQTDFSFLVNCPHMPFLSLIRIPNYPKSRTWIVDGGQLIPVRDNVMMDELIPTTQYRIHHVF